MWGLRPHAPAGSESSAPVRRIAHASRHRLTATAPGRSSAAPARLALGHRVEHRTSARRGATGCEVPARSAALRRHAHRRPQLARASDERALRAARPPTRPDCFFDVGAAPPTPPSGTFCAGRATVRHLRGPSFPRALSAAEGGARLRGNGIGADPVGRGGGVTPPEQLQPCSGGVAERAGRRERPMSIRRGRGGGAPTEKKSGGGWVGEPRAARSRPTPRRRHGCPQTPAPTISERPAKAGITSSAKRWYCTCSVDPATV